MTIFKLEKIYNKYWDLKFSIIHPRLNIEPYDTQKLRLILGLGRSGTTWISKMMATTPTCIRYFEEPIHHIIPKLNFSSFPDHTAINYCNDLSSNHRLYTAYNLLTVSKYNWKKIGLDKFLKRNDTSFKYCLVKEVHGLLATKTLLTKLKIKTVLVIRNPIYIVDSIFHAQKISSPYLINETKLIRNNLPFLKRNFPNSWKKILISFKEIQNIKDRRERKILEKALTIAILIKFLQNTANESPQNIYLIKYENLCIEPEKYFLEMASFLSFEWEKENVKKLKETTNNKDKNDPYSIFRNTKNQANRPMEFLKQGEVTKIKKLLHYCDLQYD